MVVTSSPVIFFTLLTVMYLASSCHACSCYPASDTDRLCDNNFAGIVQVTSQNLALCNFWYKCFDMTVIDAFKGSDNMRILQTASDDGRCGVTLPMSTPGNYPSTFFVSGETYNRDTSTLNVYLCSYIMEEVSSKNDPKIGVYKKLLESCNGTRMRQ